MILEITFKDNPNEMITITCDEWVPVHSSRTHEIYRDHMLLLWIHFDVVRSITRLKEPKIKLKRL